MRLDKYIASVTELSRSEVKKAIKAGLVLVDANAANNPAMTISDDSQVELDGQLLRPLAPRYFMLNKPLGYVSATKDREHMTVLELLDEDNLDQLHIAGRLDIDTTGLVLVTDDGAWSHAVTSPKRACFKTYYVETEDPIDPAMVEKFNEGVFLKQEKRRTLPATLELIDEHSARLSIQEGKYHQVKRMFAAFGNKVDVLHRESIGAIVLDPDLMEGEYRPLSDEEVASI